MDHPDWQPPKAPEVEQSQEYWDDVGQNILEEKLNQKLNTNVAKNVIVFIGMLKKKILLEKVCYCPEINKWFNIILN